MFFESKFGREVVEIYPVTPRLEQESLTGSPPHRPCNVRDLPLPVMQEWLKGGRKAGRTPNASWFSSDSEEGPPSYMTVQVTFITTLDRPTLPATCPREIRSFTGTSTQFEVLH